MGLKDAVSTLGEFLNKKGDTDGLCGPSSVSGLLPDGVDLPSEVYEFCHGKPIFVQDILDSLKRDRVIDYVTVGVTRQVDDDTLNEIGDILQQENIAGLIFEVPSKIDARFYHSMCAKGRLDRRGRVQVLDSSRKQPVGRVTFRDLLRRAIGGNLTIVEKKENWPK